MQNVIIEPVRIKALLKAADIARILKISNGKAYELIRSGRIETVMFDRSVRVTEKALERFIEESTIEARGECL